MFQRYFSEVGLCIVLVELGRIRSSHPCWVFPLLTRFSSECAATCRDALFRFSVASCETMGQSSVPRLSASAACYCTRDMNFDGIESAKDAEKFVEKELRVFIREHFKSDAAKPISGSKKHMVADYVWRKIKESKNADGTASKMFNIKPGNCSDCKERTSRILQEKMLLDAESAQATHEGAFAHHQLPSSSTSSTPASGHSTSMVPQSSARTVSITAKPFLTTSKDTLAGPMDDEDDTELLKTTYSAASRKPTAIDRRKFRCDAMPPAPNGTTVAASDDGDDEEDKEILATR